jgi:hypothetical protein
LRSYVEAESCFFQCRPVMLVMELSGQLGRGAM